MDKNKTPEEQTEPVVIETNDNTAELLKNETEIQNQEPLIEAPDLLKEAEEKLNNLNDKYLRLYSEFENYKRRTNKERIELMQTGNKEFFLSILPVIDDFERALKSIHDAKDIEALKEGINLIYHKFVTTLKTKGLEPMDIKDKVFDAEVHEAITNIPAPTEELKGKVLDELEKGYLLNGKVIRYAKVVVGA